MKGDDIPGEHHLTHYCGFAQIHEDDGTIDGSAFIPREGEESVSLNWMEYFSRLSEDQQLAEIRLVLTSKMRRIGAQAVLAILNARTTCDQAVKKSRKISVKHDPLVPPPYDDPSHSGIYGLTIKDDVLGELIAQSVLRTVPAKA